MVRRLNATDMDLEDNATYIVERLIRNMVQEQTPNLLDFDFPHRFRANATDNDERVAMINVFSALRCRVVSSYAIQPVSEIFVTTIS